MKKNTFSISLNLAIILFVASNIMAQVGINTADPKGILDFNSGGSMGVVYPNVALLATDDPDPVVNPQGGAIVPGTVVYNTNTTDNGTIPDTNVYPGIYTWDGSQWVVHYKKRQSELYNQTSVLRTEANAGKQDIPGLGIADNNEFTAKYSGLYRIEVKSNFAGGKTETNGTTFVSMASGQFEFLFNGNPYTFETSAFSAYSSYLSGGTHFEGIWKESYDTAYVNLIAGTTYPFSLTFDAYDAPGYLGNGSTTSGGTDPTLIDLINEDFNGYTITQTNNSIGCGGGTGGDQSTDGWIIFAGTCTDCLGDALFINGNGSSCNQNATAEISFLPTVNSVNISFDFEFDERSPNSDDTFRVYLHDGVSQVGGDLVWLDNLDANTSYSATISVVAGVLHTLNFEYINVGKANGASVDNVVISELSGPPTPPSTEGRGYVGKEINSQIEFTYIGE